MPGKIFSHDYLNVLISLNVPYVMSLDVLLLLGPKPVRRRALLISKGLLGPKPVRRRALLISKGLLFFFFFFFFFFFIQPSGHFWGP